MHRSYPDPEPVLTLKEAAERLGVHPATLRRWADNGDVQVRLTPGGHRRFPLSEIERLGRPADDAPVREGKRDEDMASRAITVARSGIHAHDTERWMSDMDEKEREEKRMLGRRLVGLMMQYLSRDDGDGEELLQEARAIGRLYARTSIQKGLELAEALRATMFFRDQIVESAVLLPESSRGRPDASTRVYRRINTFLNSVQLAIAGVYDAEREQADD